MEKRPCIGSLIGRSRLTKPHSSKSVWHVTLEVQDLNFSYVPGDSLAVWPENPPDEVETLLQYFSLSPQTLRATGETLQEFLTRSVDLTRTPMKLVRLIEEKLFASQEEKLKILLEGHLVRGALLLPIRHFLSYFDPRTIEPGLFLNQLLPIVPRLYSIASSQKACQNQAELAVAEVTHPVLHQERRGLCSHYLAHHAPLNEPVLRLHVHKASHFRMPDDPSTPLIMIGPGTGVAPFRAFLQELENTRDILPPLWLFFGERNKSSDFLYEEFFSSFVARGSLVLDAAFSRDAEEKMYVQHKLWEKRVQVASWIAGRGAYLYVCGNAKSMAKDVEEMLFSILQDQHVVSSYEEARSYLAHMRRGGRYALDVY